MGFSPQLENRKKLNPLILLGALFWGRPFKPSLLIGLETQNWNCPGEPRVWDPG